jgi:hypothetical protein
MPSVVRIVRVELSCWLAVIVSLITLLLVVFILVVGNCGLVVGVCFDDCGTSCCLVWSSVIVRRLDRARYVFVEVIWLVVVALQIILTNLLWFYLLLGSIGGVRGSTFENERRPSSNNESPL